MKKIALKNHISETDLFRNRLFAAAGAIGLFAFLLFGRLVYLQLIEHRLYSTLSRQNLLSVIPIEPNRGLIYDRNGVILAKNIPSYTLQIIPSKVDNIDNLFAKLKNLLGLSDDDIAEYNRVRNQYRNFEPVPLMFKLTEQQVAQFYTNQFQLPGVMIQTRMMRYYPLGDVTGDVVGYVGRINPVELTQVDHDNYTASTDIGKRGIEQYYEAILRGKMGAEQAEIDASGHIVRSLKRVPPISGNDLYLTIDSGLQAVAQKALGEHAGVIVAIQPSTGQVLALVSQPSFDPNLFVNGVPQATYTQLLNAPGRPLYNRALRGQYSSASTIKPFYALFGLDDGVVTPDYTINDPGWFQIPGTNHIFHDWVKKGHGLVNVSKAIMESCDVYFYNLAMMMGIKRMDAVLDNFGFGKPTGIDLPGEAAGLVPTPEWKQAKTGSPWYMGDTIVLGIGQGYFLVTPLQLANAVATMANRGERYQPQVLLKSVDNDNNTITPSPKLLGTVTLNNPDNWAIVIAAMQQGIMGPQAHSDYFGANPPFTVAGKTGTAQVYGNDGRDEYDDNQANIPLLLRHNHLFIAFAPVDNPQIAVAIVVEHSAMAGFMARQVMDYYFKHPATNLPAYPDPKTTNLPMPGAAAIPAPANVTNTPAPATPSLPAPDTAAAPVPAAPTPSLPAPDANSNAPPLLPVPVGS